ncbi:MAG TPA: NADH:ubiquinone reductase (Na(+)-transporting) subunit F, partial [Saprospiraceae bacterium]|nr:NADH:ubiquinone reductase (Na(+)-transporting) subunit F [Saprospiraceae bacterium]
MLILLSTLVNIVLAVVVFSTVILLLAFMLISARRRLVPQGDVRIIVNGDEENPILAKPGSSLLATLSDRNIFLPSACGGGGT